MPPKLADLIGAGGECVFTWVTRTGDPMGVVVSYLYRDGKFWTTSLTSRARIKALASRSRSAIVLNNSGRSATFKGRSVLHRPGDPDWDATLGVESSDAGNWLVYASSNAATQQRSNAARLRGCESSKYVSYQDVSR